MSTQSNSSQQIQVGDTVVYKLRTGESVHAPSGTVIALFNVQTGETLAEVRWNRIWPPQRVNVENLTKA